MNQNLEAVITCPSCSSRHKETMPTDACQYFWVCPSCESIIKPEEGDCCVFCSYSDTYCTSRQ